MSEKEYEYKPIIPKQHAAKRDWTVVEEALLLDLYFSGTGITPIARTLECSVSSVRSKLWKLSTGYRGCAHSVEASRLRKHSRRGCKFTKREIDTLKLGRSYNIGELALSRLLARDADEIANACHAHHLTPHSRPTLL